MMDAWLNNISITRKLFLAPFIALLLASLIALLALRSLDKHAALLDEVTTSDVERAAAMAALGRAIPEVSRTVNRFVALASNSDDQAALSRLVGEMERQLAEATLLSRKISSYDLQGAGKDPADRLDLALKAYALIARQVVNMAASDAATGYLMSNNGEKVYMELQSALEALRERERARALSRRDASAAEAYAARIYTMILFVVAVLASALVTVILSRIISGPIVQLAKSTMKIADGDLSAEVAGSQRRDEIGALAAAVDVLRENALEKRRIEDEQRNLQRKTSARQEAIEQHIAHFRVQVREALKDLGVASQEMGETSIVMSDTASMTSAQITAVGRAFEETSTNVQTVAAASEELSASISEISRQVNSASGIIDRAVEEARQTDGTVAGLVDAVSVIRDVVRLINDIAAQTNLLALNATIEAARAGDAGRGFAVVANEVKALAGQTAKATGEISAQIETVQNVTTATATAMRRIDGTIAEVSSIATSIAAAVEQQSAATLEITRSTQRAAAHALEVSADILGVRQGADTTGRAALGVQSASEGVTLQGERLREQVDDFLGRIRAA